VLVARTVLANSANRPVTESVQCYVLPPRTSEDSPRSVLVGFQKVALPARGSVTVEFRLDASSLAQVDASGLRAHAPGRYGVVVGSASPGARAQALGAPEPATAEINVV